MRLSLSILTSAALQTAFVACALLGSWHIDPPSLEFISDQTSAQQVAVYIPPPVVKLDPIIEPVPEEPVATTIKETRSPQTPPAVRVEKKPQPKPPKILAKRPEKQPLEKPPAPRPDTPKLKTLVASVQDDAPATPAQLADEQAPSVAVAAATLAPAATTASTTPAIAAITPSKTATTAGGVKGDVDRSGILKSYKRLLFSTIDRKKSVPRAARRARLQGTVYLSVTLDASGKILSVKVRKSSGHATLDEGAVDTMRSLGKLPAPPEALGWTKKTLTIPIRYKIK